MKKINYWINFILGALKWPMGILMLALIVPAFQADFYLVSTYTNSTIAVQFFAPLAATILLFLLMPGLTGSFLAIVEHEMTHMFFAILTFHKPKALDVHQDIGGSFSFAGQGNWLIALAPYFFPLFTVIAMIGISLSKAFGLNMPELFLPLMGFLVGYHFIVTAFSIHPKQTDFQVAGPFFSFCFIPGANLLVYGLLFAYVLKGWGGFPAYFELLYAKTLDIFTKIG